MAERASLEYGHRESALAPSIESDDPEVIQRQIDYTRAQMTATISQIGDRLSPQYLIEQAKTSVKDAAAGRIRDMSYQANRRFDEMSSTAESTVRSNPLPVALIGLGLGWLILSERKRRNEYEFRSAYPYRTTGYRYYEGNEPGMMDQARYRLNEAGEMVQDRAANIQGRVSETAQRAGEAVSDSAHRATEAVSETAQRAGEAASDTAQRVTGTITDAAQRVGETVGERKEIVQERAAEMSSQARHEAERLASEARWRAQVGIQRTRQTFWESMEQNPLTLGAVMLVAGAAISAAIPATEYENKLMGETRDRLMHEAKARAQDTVERVQTVVEEAQHAAVSEARTVAERENLPIGGSTRTTEPGGLGGSRV